MSNLSDSDSTRDFLQGQLIVAMPNLRDGCFRESVVLICSHDADHAMGLILNKTISDLSFADLLGQVDIPPAGAAMERPIHFGGPVDTKRGAVLHSDDYRRDDTIDIVPGVCLTATREILQDINASGAGPSGRLPGDGAVSAGAPRDAIICAGHAGWSAGQLEHELAQNAWLNMDADPALIFSGDVNNLWTDALARMGIDTSMFSEAWSQMREPDAPLN